MAFASGIVGAGAGAVDDDADVDADGDAGAGAGAGDAHDGVDVVAVVGIGLLVGDFALVGFLCR